MRNRYKCFHYSFIIIVALHSMAFNTILRNVQRLAVSSGLRSQHALHYSSIHRKFSVSVTSYSPIYQVFVNNANETVEVQFGKNISYEYPWIYLQDNCTCPLCFHASSKSRKKLMTSLDLEKRISVATVDSDGGAVSCVWTDGHLSEFSKTWLLERRFTEENRKSRSELLRDEPELFGSDYQIQRGNFEEVLQTPKRLVHLLKTVCKNGVYILEGAPKNVGQLRKLVNKFGFIRTTHYGDEFTVKSEKNASNIAYTSTTLCVHTDLPYYAYPPSIQLLHCIKQYEADTDGGMSHLVDGFHVAAHMKEEYPQNYKILSSVPVEFADIGKDFTKFHKIHHSPTFVHSENGQLTRIVYSNQQLSSFLPIPIGQVKLLYESLKLFTNLCYDPRNLIKFKLKDGDILVFDNWRLLHGREGFDAAQGDRHVEGCYVDWDEIYSSIRVLETEIRNS